MEELTRKTHEIRALAHSPGKETRINRGIRIVLIDGRELVRHGLRHVLESETDMKVVGDYASAEEALFAIIRLSCDIVIMGTWMPGISWLEATRSLKRNRLYSGSDVIIIAETEHYRAEALEAGATSYFLKDMTGAELIQTIRQIHQDKHPAKEPADLAEEAIELVIPPPANIAQLMRFMRQLAEILHDGFASIICMAGSWDRGTTIAVRPYATADSSLIVALAQLAGVEKVEEERIAEGAFPKLHKKLEFLPRLGVNPGTRLRVTLQDADIASSTRNHMSN
jgi:DNA-binding NarL/FixJ family response regulator